MVPEGVDGIVGKVSPSEWVEYGAPLIEIGTAVAGASPVAEDVRESGVPDGCIAVVSESDGTIYLSPDPQSPPFAPVGGSFAPKATLALIEVMKTFSPVRSAVAGRMERVFVSSGSAVQSGTTLFWIRTV